MRTQGTLLLATLAACATSAPPGADPRWRQIQAHRLERLHEARQPTATLAAILGQDPQPATGRQHLDQREPAGFRHFREPQRGWVAAAIAGIGHVSFDAAGSQLDDTADAHFLRVSLESDKGTGVGLEVWGSDDDLFAGTRINDGVVPVAADARLQGMSLEPYLVFDGIRQGAFTMPVRIGVYGEWQRLAHENATVRREWISFGPRLELEPALRLVGDDTARLELFGRAAGELGPAWFAEQFRGGSDHDVTARWAIELDAGLRGRVGRMNAELGYGLHHAGFGATDTELLGDRSRTDVELQMLFLGVGLRF